MKAATENSRSRTFPCGPRGSSGQQGWLRYCGARPWLLYRRATTTALVALATVLVALPPSHAQQSDHAKVLGMKLMCTCGCGQVLVQCNHIGCPSSVPMLKELDRRIANGESDDLILQDFVQQYGEQVLSEPPNRGFNRVAWLLPGVALATGLGVVLLVILSWRRRPQAALGPPRQVSAEELLRAKQIADRETED
jgi:cytochrome c-type biogenesis protein CcmH/NrfF